MDVRVEGQTIAVAENADIASVLKSAMSGKKFKSIVAASIDGKTYDLSSPLPAGCTEITPIVASSPEGLEMIRHSTAHVMALAVKKLFPNALVTIGPAIENGFYYDFDVEKPFTQGDLEQIEAEMHRIAAARIPFVRSEMSSDEAKTKFGSMGEKYKVEIIDDLGEANVSLYQLGDFVDLCRGPHVPNSGFCDHVRLTAVAGAYWRGNEKNRMLSRIYGTAFADEKALKDYLHQMEEAKRRDHRKLGRELGFFTFFEHVAPGMVFWLPKGMLMRTILEDFWKREHLKRGYSIVQGPQLLRQETWKQSGHYDHYRQNMYFTEIDEEMYGIKPMNCIGHMLIYGNSVHSYRDMPERFFFFGLVHRHEKSGVLHGLLRVRQFTQDDAHILCTPEQLESEIINVIRLIQDLMTLFDFKYKIEISTRPEDSIGTDEAWELATNALIEAVRKEGLPYSINEGDGAFYGPKIDVKLLDCIGREWQCSTIQVDFTLPERFNLTYVGQDGERHRPVMVHRAIMGSVERFIGVLIEQYAGALPVWLAPEQARLLTVTDAAIDAARDMEKTFAANGIRVSLDDRNEKLGFKVREAQVNKIPYMLVVGEKEAQSGTVSVRLRTGENLGMKTVEETIELIRAAAAEPFTKGGMSYSFA